MRALFAVVFSATVVACVSSSGLTGGAAPDPSDAAASDSSTPPSDSATTSDAAATGDAEAGAGPNLLTNGDFELGCAGWDVSFGFMSEATEAHGGSRSCKFCMDTNWEAFLEQAVPTNVEAGKTYYVEAWLKPAKPLSELDAAGFAETNVRVTAPTAKIDPTTGPTATGDWLRSTAIFKPSLPASELSVDVRLQQTGNPADVGNVICFYVDDVVLRRLD